MKKFLSILLALALVLSLGTVAFAVEGEWDGTYTPTEAFTFQQIDKTYNSENDVVVNETLSFTSTPGSKNPDNGAVNLTVDNLTVTSLNPGKITVNVPSLSKAGIYEWTIKEIPGTTAGVTYSTAEIHVTVLVEYDNTNHALKIAETQSYIKKENGEKASTFENTFKSGSFTVAKNVEGNMADVNDEFDITVTLTSEKPVRTNIIFAGETVTPDQWEENTYTKTMKYSEIDGAKTFANIPEGVTVSVVEDTAENKMMNYSYTSTNDTQGNDFSMTVADTDENKKVVVTNTRNSTVDTGVFMDSLPYVLLLVGACAGLVVFFARRRMTHKG